jgi:hypothetical protein
LTTILLRAESLRSLILYADVHPSVMDIVSHVSPFTLRELALFIDNASSNSLSLIGKFLNLEDLTLMVFSGYLTTVLTGTLLTSRPCLSLGVT